MTQFLMKSSMLGALGAILGGLGLIVHGALATAVMPLLYNHYSALWASAMLVVASAELVVISRTAFEER
jgi:hypothetical protein